MIGQYSFLAGEGVEKFISFDDPPEPLHFGVIGTAPDDQTLIILAESGTFCAAVIPDQHKMATGFQNALKFGQSFFAIEPMSGLCASDQIDRVAPPTGGARGVRT